MASASKPVKWLRAFLAGKKRLDQPLRYAPEQSTRDVPAANLPGGAAHKLSTNYYYSRDGRRAKIPPELVALNASVKLITETPAEQSTAVGQVDPPTPGVPLLWTKSTTDATPFGTGAHDHQWYYKQDKVDLHVRPPQRGTDIVGN
ncbi:NADH dehydrogenase [ubiquinone] 1 alpha subcomplex subunit 7-like [Symsagittifera roscoffensis]|uniref:NADH dehydrogenase [ubiquinone] 1 alpha subcomplex subunit 7-like n=1 Tax=Symsagittifera roscoffensis TaxID=84072 RepID=UPI00307CC109